MDDLENLTRLVTRYFRTHAAPFGLQPKAVKARYILNWGGFVNASFTISDKVKKFHLKLIDDEEPRLWQFSRFQEPDEPGCGIYGLLESHYRAPKMLDWILLNDGEFEGALFEHIEGAAADFRVQPALRQEVLQLQARLHADRELADLLMELDGEPGSCAGHFLDTYIDRFDEDLLIVVRDLPPFVSLQTLDWMQGETRHLEALAWEMPAFDVPAAFPTHGDLWPNNVLVDGAGDWHVIDWDDLVLGDPALDYSIVLSDLWRARAGEDISGSSLLPPDIPQDPAMKERLAVCLRAYLLDEVIDTLADYVEAEFAPEFQERVKEEKRRVHLDALALYQQLYGFAP